MAKLGIVGGSGLYTLPNLSVTETLSIETPFGNPSSPPRSVSIGQSEVIFIARHGDKHILSPSDVPYRANIYALKMLGVTHVVSVSAVGSLKASLPPRTMVLPDQIIDRTVQRERTFFEQGIVAHVSIADPFCPHLSRSLVDTAASIGVGFEFGGTYVCIEGPQFSTRAESNVYRSWEASVIGMTAMPEARLAREAELCYATIALVTDYDVWHESEEPVTIDLVLQHLHANVAVAGRMIEGLVDHGLPDRQCDCADALGGALITQRDQIPPEQRERLGVIGSRYFDESTARPA